MVAAPFVRSSSRTLIFASNCTAVLRTAFVPLRSFSSSHVNFARQKPKPRPVSKATLAAKEKKRALKARKNAYDHEKMTMTEALNVLRAVEVARPHSTFELVIKTAMKRGSAVPKGRVNLPYEVKAKTQDRVLVFAEGRKAEEAKRAGAFVVGGAELVDGVANGRYNATTYLCTPDLIRAITPKLGRILGPRGLMPSERRGTVTDDIAGYMRKISGSSEWKGDRSGTIRAVVGKINFPVRDVVQNTKHFLDVVRKATGNVSGIESGSGGGKHQRDKPVNAITKVVLSSTQGPGIQISDV